MKQPEFKPKRLRADDGKFRKLTLREHIAFYLGVGLMVGFLGIMAVEWHKEATKEQIAYIWPIVPANEVYPSEPKKRDLPNPTDEFQLVKKAEAKTLPVERDSEKSRPTGDIHEIIKAASDKYGVSYKLMSKIAECESGYNPKAANKYSSARGLYQYIKSTWANHVKKKGLGWTLDDRFDPVKSADLTARIIAEGGLMQNWAADSKSYNCWKGAL